MNERMNEIINDYNNQIENVKDVEEIKSIRAKAKRDLAEEFILFEKSKGEQLCKKTEHYLYKRLKNDAFKVTLNSETKEYSSGKKVGCFDEYFLFLRYNADIKTTNEFVILSTEEIQDYAKSHRVLICEPIFSVLIQVFEHKRSII